MLYRSQTGKSRWRGWRRCGQAVAGVLPLLVSWTLCQACSSRNGRNDGAQGSQSSWRVPAQPSAPRSDLGPPSEGRPPITTDADDRTGEGAHKGTGDASTPAPDAGPPPLDGTVDGAMETADATVGDAGMARTPIAAPTPVGCVGDVGPGLHRFDCDGALQVVSVPEMCTRFACGVILDVHGGMMSSQMQDKNTNLRALGAQHGFIVIQPNALQNPILLNQRLFVADAPGLPGDDTRVMRILEDVMQAFRVDRRRIHMTGFSEGGFMTWRWLCEHADLLASVAPAAAGWQCANLANLGLTPPEIGCEMSGTDRPARAIPILYMQGTVDGLVDPQCVQRWIEDNLLPTLAVDTGTVVAGDPDFATADYVRTRYEDPEGVPFEYIQHQYASDAAFLGVPIVGHCFPGSDDHTPTPPGETVVPPDQLMAFGCQGNSDFHWGNQVVEFFLAHPKD